MAQICFAVAALIHIYIFVLESCQWGRPKTNRIFGMKPEQAEAARALAFNQGFYNLFLAVAAAWGLIFHNSTLLMYSAGSMVAASLVLSISQPKLVRPVLIQGLAPLLGLVFSQLL